MLAARPCQRPPLSRRPNPWSQGAPFPEASEELLGAPAGGKFYVFAGLAPGWKPKAMVFEYDPASNQWIKKRPMRLASANGIEHSAVAFNEILRSIPS